MSFIDDQIKHLKRSIDLYRGDVEEADKHHLNERGRNREMTEHKRALIPRLWDMLKALEKRKKPPEE